MARKLFAAAMEHHRIKKTAVRAIEMFWFRLHQIEIMKKRRAQFVGSIGFQRLWRGYLRRNRYMRWKTAAIRIQAWYRSAFRRRWYGRLQTSAFVAQRIVRGFIGRARAKWDSGRGCSA